MWIGCGLTGLDEMGTSWGRSGEAGGRVAGRVGILGFHCCQRKLGIDQCIAP